MAESLLVRKGGGGLKIEEIIEEYKVASGETITAGTFVDYINGVVTNTPTLYTDVSGSTSFMNAVALTPERVVIAYATDNFIRMKANVITFTNNTVNIGTTLITHENPAGGEIVVERMSDTVAILGTRNANTSDCFVRALTVNTSTLTLTSGSDVLVSANSEIFGIASLNTNHFAVVYRNGGFSNRGDMKVYSLSGSSISQMTVDTFNNFLVNYLSVIRTALNEIAILYYDSNSTNFIGRAWTWNGSNAWSNKGAITNLILGSEFAFVGSRSRPVMLTSSIICIPTFRSGSLPTSGSNLFLINKTSLTITANPLGVTNFVNSATVSDVRIAYDQTKSVGTLVYRKSNNQTAARTFSYNGTSLIISTEQIISVPTIFPQSLIFLSNTRFLFTHSNTPSSYILSTEKLITNTSAEKVFGLAKTGGTEGETIEVFVNE
jgi:hypothetical protein